jgi:hypothetical protein
MQKDINKVICEIIEQLTNNTTFIRKYPKYSTLKGILKQVTKQNGNDFISISYMKNINLNGYDNYDIETMILKGSEYNIKVDVNNCLIGY